MSRPPRAEISVVVPSYNKPEYLPECLESIRAQTFTDWECIVVSDGSPRVEEIRAAVAAMGDERFRLVEHKENRGLAAARNTGVRESRADLVICVDEDDRLHPDCLNAELRAMEDTGAEIVACRARYFGGREGYFPLKSPSLAEILYTQPLPPCGFLMKKAIWTCLGGWDEHPTLRLGREDHEWWIRVVAGRGRLACLDEALYEYRTPVGAGGREVSLNHRAMLNEVRIRRYIVRKHADLYGRYHAARTKYLRQAYLQEAQALESSGRRVRGAWRYWGAFFVSWTEKDFRAALRKTMELMLGQRWTERLVAWRRRWVARRG